MTDEDRTTDAKPEGTSGSRSDLYDIFISYSQSDKAIAREIARVAAERDLRVWFDEWQLRPGQNWRRAIEQAIDHSKSCLILLGETSSPTGPWISKEWSEILRRAWAEPGFKLVVARISPDVELPPFLRGLASWTFASRHMMEESDRYRCRAMLDDVRRDLLQPSEHRQLELEPLHQRQLDRGRAEHLRELLEAHVEQSNDE